MGDVNKVIPKGENKSLYCDKCGSWNAVYYLAEPVYVKGYNWIFTITHGEKGRCFLSSGGGSPEPRCTECENDLGIKFVQSTELIE